MGRSFGVCWDGVFQKAQSEADKMALFNHTGVLYLLSLREQDYAPGDFKFDRCGILRIEA